MTTIVLNPFTDYKHHGIDVKRGEKIAFTNALSTHKIDVTIEAGLVTAGKVSFELGFLGTSDTYTVSETASFGDHLIIVTPQGELPEGVVGSGRKTIYIIVKN